MTSCQSIRKCREDHKRYEAFRIKEEICKKNAAAQEEVRRIRGN